MSRISPGKFSGKADEYRQEAGKSITGGLDRLLGLCYHHNISTMRITIDAKDLLPPKKAAQFLGITTMTLWRWVRDGKITSVMLDHRYFHISELNRVKGLNPVDKGQQKGEGE